MTNDPVSAVPTFANPPTRLSHIARTLRLARKELREILRDRRTMLTLVAMPLLLYPLMSVVFTQIYMAHRMPDRGPVYHVGVLTPAENLAFTRRFDLGLREWLKAQGKPIRAKGPIKEKMAPQLIAFGDPEMRPIDKPQDRADALERLKEWLREGSGDIVVTIDDLDPTVINPQEDPIKDSTWNCQIFYVPTSGRSMAALADVNTMFAAANEVNLRERLGVKGRVPRIDYLKVKRVVVEVPGAGGVISLAALVPLILILMTITGAVYPAIDLTAGERERGTLEILIAAPVSRFELLSAKYISVVSVAILTALVNLLCMMATIFWSGLGAALFREQGFSLPLLIQVLALLLLFAAFFSAVLLCLTSFARSFKEAQAYLIPLMLASLTPGAMAMLPGLELKGILTVVPLVNIVLMARDLFEGQVDALVTVIVVITTLIYALAALALAARVFGAENVLYGEQSGWSDLFRRPVEPQPSLSIPAALWCLALMLPCQFVANAFVRWLMPGLVLSVVLMVLVNMLLFGLLPAAFMYVGRVMPRTGFGLQRPHLVAISAAVLLALSLWPIQLEALKLVADTEMFASFKENYKRALEDIKNTEEQLGLGVLVVVIVPAILEELFFRGLLFNALRARCSAHMTIFLSGLLFGLTHVVLGEALGLMRLIPSTALGLILGAVCWRAGSVWPCLILHVCHNTILLLIGIYGLGPNEDIILGYLQGAGIVGTVIAAGLLGLWNPTSGVKPA